MKPGDHIYAPPAGRQWSPESEWVAATVDYVGRRETYRDPTPDRDHRVYQWVTVRYDDGSTAKVELDILEAGSAALKPADGAAGQLGRARRAPGERSITHLM